MRAESIALANMHHEVTKGVALVCRALLRQGVCRNCAHAMPLPTEVGMPAHSNAQSMLEGQRGMQERPDIASSRTHTDLSRSRTLEHASTW